MYKVIKPLPGYGYEVGEVTQYIAAVDVPRFIKHKHIEVVEAPAPEPEPAEAPKKAPKKGPKS